MTIELTMAAWALVLAFVQILLFDFARTGPDFGASGLRAVAIQTATATRADKPKLKASMGPNVIGSNGNALRVSIATSKLTPRTTATPT